MYILSTEFAFAQPPQKNFICSSAPFFRLSRPFAPLGASCRAPFRVRRPRCPPLGASCRAPLRIRRPRCPPLGAPCGIAPCVTRGARCLHPARRLPCPCAPPVPLAPPASRSYEALPSRRSEQEKSRGVRGAGRPHAGGGAKSFPTAGHRIFSRTKRSKGTSSMKSEGRKMT